MLALSPLGLRALSWVADPDSAGSSELHLVLQDGGGEVMARSTLRDPLGSIEPHGEAPPQIAFAPDGEILALYTVGRVVPGRRFPASALRLARTTDGGKRWTVPVTVNEGEAFGSHNFHSLLVAPDGTVYAAWLSAVQGSSGVWLRRSDDTGSTWLPSQPIHTEPTCPCCRTALAVGPDGTLYAAWRNIFPGDVRDIVVMRSEDRGATWSTPVRPRADEWVFPGCPHAGPSLQVDPSSVVHIAWWTGREGEAGVWYARSHDGGRTFMAEPVAVGQRSMPAHVQLALAPNGPVLAWDDGLGAQPGILIRHLAEAGAPVLRLTTPEVAASYPVIAVAADSLVVVWSQLGTHAHHAAEAARPDMRDPSAVMPLPRVGQSEIFARSGPLSALSLAKGGRE
jgi:hypothetical protein